MIENFRGAVEHHLPPLFARPRPQIDDAVARTHHVGIMFDDDHGIADRRRA